MKNANVTNLSADKIAENYEQFFSIIDSFVERGPNLAKLYKSFGERLMFEPASSFEHFHNAIPGGYIDHVLRVVEFSEKVYELYKSLGLNCSNFTRDELRFAAFNHDLGKLGFSGESNGQYVPNKSSWHKEKLGRVYEINSNIPFLTVADRTIYLLQLAEVPVSLNEFLAMKLTDGLYDENNKAYLMANKAESKLRSDLPMILHHADMLASKIEYSNWASKQNLSDNMSFNSLNGDLSDEFFGPKKAAPKKAASSAKEEDTFSNMENLFDNLFS